VKPLYINILLGIVALAAVAFGLYEYRLANPAPAPAAAAAAPAANFFLKASDGDWKLRCQKDAPDKCIGIVNVANKNKQLVMVWMVGLARTGGLGMTIETPTGVTLAPGLDFTLDANAVHHMSFGACGPNACQARMLLDSATLDEMRKAAKASVSFALANGRKVTYTVPVRGTDKMLADIAPPAAAAPSAP